MEYPSNFEGYLFFCLFFLLFLNFISVAKKYRKILIYLQDPKQKKVIKMTLQFSMRKFC